MITMSHFLVFFVLLFLLIFLDIFASLVDATMTLVCLRRCTFFPFLTTRYWFLTSFRKFLLQLHLATLCNFDDSSRLILLIGGSLLHGINDVCTSFNSSEDYMLTIEMWRPVECYEEL